jgi:hypothetical protein
MTDLMATVRPTSHPTPVPALAPSVGGTTLITQQQVLFSTAAAGALHRAKTSRWAAVVNSVSTAMSALFTDSRPPGQRYVPRRSVYLENGVMARAMYRL